MIELSDIVSWGKLESPFGNACELPALIEELSETFSKDIADTICWEYIYHQNTLYSATIVTIPYLVKIIKSSNDKDFQWYLTSYLGVILCELDDEGIYLTSPNPSNQIKPECNFEWLTYYVEKLKIDDLKWIILYLFGELNCPVCQARLNVFECLVFY